MNEQNTIDTLVALITEGQIKSDEQAKGYKLALEQSMQSIREEFNLVNQKLDKIESNTVTIMGVLITDFPGIFPETLAELEETSQHIEPFAEVLEDCVEKIKKGEPVPSLKNPKRLVKPNAVNILGHYGTVSVAECLDNLGLEKNQGGTHLIPLGNYVNSIITKIWGVKFGKRQPVFFAPLIESLITYHETERNSPRQY